MLAQRSFSIGFLILVYVSGIIGMYSPWHDWFVSLTPLSLLLSAGILLAFSPEKTRNMYAWCAFSFLMGFVAEVIGVNTGWPFGVYQYGSVLGPQWWNTPLMIGTNWFIVTYAANEAVQRRTKGRWPFWATAIAAALICTGLDVLIEPVAIRLGYWTWADGVPPLQNYMGWFGVSLLISLPYTHLAGRHTNPAAPILLVLQVVFFIALRFLPG
jgi:bisanhydrobacterioruberin hydratase